MADQSESAKNLPSESSDLETITQIEKQIHEENVLNKKMAAVAEVAPRDSSGATEEAEILEMIKELTEEEPVTLEIKTKDANAGNTVFRRDTDRKPTEQDDDDGAPVAKRKRVLDDSALEEKLVAVPVQERDTTFENKKIEGGSVSVEMVTSPEWLPPSWVTMLKERKSGASKGHKDKYYFDPVSKRRFRSFNEVQSFLTTGGECIRRGGREQRKNTSTKSEDPDISDKQADQNL